MQLFTKMVDNKAKIWLAILSLFILCNMTYSQDAGVPDPSDPIDPVDPMLPEHLSSSEELTKLCEANDFQELIIPYPHDEQHFVVCNGNVGILGNCGYKKCYDQATTLCGACPDVDCSNKQVLDHIPVSCQIYYICLGNTENPVPVTCPSAQHYSESEKKCMSPVEAMCQTPSEWCTNQKDGTVFPAEKCHEYYECKKQEIFLKSCPYNQYFDKENGTCVTGICSNKDGTTSERLPTCTADNDGIKMAHPKCHQYYMCLKQVLYVAQCPSGYYFNDQSKKCVKDVNNECNDS